MKAVWQTAGVSSSPPPSAAGLTVNADRLVLLASTRKTKGLPGLPLQSQVLPSHDPVCRLPALPCPAPFCPCPAQLCPALPSYALPLHSHALFACEGVNMNIVLCTRLHWLCSVSCAGQSGLTSH